MVLAACPVCRAPELAVVAALLGAAAAVAQRAAVVAHAAHQLGLVAHVSQARPVVHEELAVAQLAVAAQPDGLAVAVPSEHLAVHADLPVAVVHDVRPLRHELAE